MPYDKSLDECIAAKPVDVPAGRITVSVYSYNQGPKKLQIVRENANDAGDYNFAKLGRMTKEEVSAILPAIQELVDKLD